MINDLEIDDIGYILQEGKVLALKIISITKKREEDGTLSLYYVGDVIPRVSSLKSLGKKQGEIFKTQDLLFDSLRIDITQNKSDDIK